MANQLPNGPMASSSGDHTQLLKEGSSGGQGGKGVTYSITPTMQVLFEHIRCKSLLIWHLVMTIGWIPSCTDYQSQPTDNPMGQSGDSTESYATLIKDTYYKCMFLSAIFHYWRY